jgi:putative IMPACT (imprinted ancient) family translation regulator
MLMLLLREREEIDGSIFLSHVAAISSHTQQQQQQQHSPH